MRPLPANLPRASRLMANEMGADAAAALSSLWPVAQQRMDGWMMMVTRDEADRGESPAAVAASPLADCECHLFLSLS